MITILLVEDDTDLRGILETFLSEVFAVDAVKNGVEALQKVSDNHFDLILSDHNMPLMSGLRLLKEIRSQGQSTPFILMSGGMDVSEESALEFGAQGYFDKGSLNFTSLIQLILSLTS